MHSHTSWNHSVDYKPIASSSLAIWQVAHCPQNDITKQSLKTEPVIPPRVLILALRAIMAPGTKNGMHAHSPVLEAMLHMVHGKHSQVIKHDLKSLKQSNTPEVQSLWPSIVPIIIPPWAPGWFVSAIICSYLSLKCSSNVSLVSSVSQGSVNTVNRLPFKTIGP